MPQQTVPPWQPRPRWWAWFVDDSCWAAAARTARTTWVSSRRCSTSEQTAGLEDELTIVRPSTSSTGHRVDAGVEAQGGGRRDGKPVLNVDLMQAIDRAITGRRVRFEWVKATPVIRSTNRPTGWPTSGGGPTRLAGCRMPVRFGDRVVPSPVRHREQSVSPGSSTDHRSPRRCGERVRSASRRRRHLRLGGTLTPVARRRPARSSGGLAREIHGHRLGDADVDPPISSTRRLSPTRSWPPSRRRGRGAARAHQRRPRRGPEAAGVDPRTSVTTLRSRHTTDSGSPTPTPTRRSAHSGRGSRRAGSRSASLQHDLVAGLPPGGVRARWCARPDRRRCLIPARSTM